MKHLISRIVAAVATGLGTVIFVNPETGAVVTGATLAYALIHRILERYVDPKDQAKEV